MGIGRRQAAPLEGWFALVIGAICVLSAPWLTFGWYELRIDSKVLILQCGVGPLNWRRRMPVANVRKVERVDEVDERSGRPLSTTFHVFGRHQTWSFGQALLRPAADHLWNDLSVGWPSSRRIERTTPSAD